MVFSAAGLVNAPFFENIGWDILIPQAELGRLSDLLGSGQYSALEGCSASLLQRYPECGFGWKTLGISRFMQGKDALSALNNAAQLLPDDVEAHYNFGIALQKLGQFDLAAASYQQALRISPCDVEILARLGAVLHKLGQSTGAIAIYRRLLDICPDHAETHLNLGNLLKLGGQYDQAKACYLRALQCQPNFAQAYFNLGVCEQELGQLEAAIGCYRRALDQQPGSAETHLNLGHALCACGLYESAEASYRAALQCRPNYAEALLALGNVLQALGQFEPALENIGKALEIAPDWAVAHFNFANVLKNIGRFDEAVARYRRVLQLDPDFFAAHDNLLFSHNLFEQSAETMLADAIYFGVRVERQASPFSDWKNQPKPEKCLRVGFVSGDFRDHSVSRFLESVMAALRLNAAGRLELFAYSNGAVSDEITDRVKNSFHQWHQAVACSDEELARKIYTDGIDILIDLSGHTEFNRLPMFAWKPAPIQASWLGYHATIGVAAMDYMVADHWTIREGDEACFTEKIWRLPETLWCLTPPAVDVPVTTLPALSTGQITFACFNNLDKVNPAVVAVWARVLQAVPGSCLFLKAKQLQHESVCRQITARFATQGITADRLILEGPSSRALYLAAYQLVDIALDPFPYAGATTTVDSLWMGVPVMSLAGKTFMSRQGVSLLMNAGLPEWIAADVDDYVVRVVAQAADLSRLALLRKSLRQQVQASPLFDAPRFAGNFEEMLRGMWRGWCVRRLAGRSDE